MVGMGSSLKWGALLLASLLVVGVMGAAATYESLDELPEPDMVFEDNKFDLTKTSGRGTAEIGWQDILEVQIYTTEESLIFVIVGNGPMPPPPRGLGLHPMLFVLLDVEQRGSHVQIEDVQNWTLMTAKGYDFLIGYYGSGVGIRSVRGSKLGSPVPIDHWRSENTVYFEIPWTRIGIPETVLGFLVYSENLPHNLALEITRDLAPDGYPALIGAGAGAP